MPFLPKFYMVQSISLHPRMKITLCFSVTFKGKKPLSRARQAGPVCRRRLVPEEGLLSGDCRLKWLFFCGRLHALGQA